MKKVYIVLTNTGTFLSRIVNVYTRKEFSHVSISLDENLNYMYSFGRLMHIIHLLVALFMNHLNMVHLKDLRILKQRYIL